MSIARLIDAYCAVQKQNVLKQDTASTDTKREKKLLRVHFSSSLQNAQSVGSVSKKEDENTSSTTGHREEEQFFMVSSHDGKSYTMRRVDPVKPNV